MPFLRTSKSLSERVAAELPPRGRGLRGARRFACWTLVALAGCWLLWQQRAGNDRVFHAGSISQAHQFIANDCARCHQESWQPLQRLVSFDNSATSTPDAACIQCHAGPQHNEHPSAQMAHCAHCHREHHGQAALAAVDNRFCTACHADLKEDAIAPLHFAAQIADFAQHPEFALFRADVPPATDSSTQHGVHQVAQWSAGGTSPAWRDKSAIRFHHQKHLQPSDPRGQPTPTGAFEHLDCQSCHQPDGAGQYMRPIAYEQHCARCHPLNYGAELELGAPLPHRDVQLVRDAMRSRLSEAFRTMQPADAASIQVTPRRIPGAAGSAPIRPGELDWVNQRLVSAEHVVFGKEAKGGCRFCHTLEERDSGLSVTPTAIPDRWQTHARFNHASHRLLDCGACHDRATGSTATAEILLPGIAICRECHGASASKSGQAGDRCVECHDYHDHGQDTLAGRLGLNLEPVGVRQRTSATADEAVQP